MLSDIPFNPCTIVYMKSTEVLNPRHGFIMHALVYIHARVYIDYAHAYTLYTCMPSRYVRVTERYTENCTCDKMADLNRYFLKCVIARDVRLELTDRHTHTQTKYCNPRCACVPRVNNTVCLCAVVCAKYVSINACHTDTHH